MQYFSLLRSGCVLNILIPMLLLSACGGGSSLDSSNPTAPGANAQAERSSVGIQGKSSASAAARSDLPSALWSASERAQVLPLTSGDGVSTTSSSARAMLDPALGIAFGGRAAKEDWPRAINRFRSTPSLANWVRNNEMVRVDAWMARNFEQADKVGGWPQAYINTSTGVPMAWSPASPEPAEDAPGTDDLHSVKRAWVALGRNYNIAQMQAAARIYRLSAQQRYADWAAQQLDFYANNYSRWPLRTRDGGARMYLNGLDEAVASFQLLDTARLLQPYVDPARYQAWYQQLFAPMANNLRGTITPLSNIQLWHMGAIAAIAMRFGDEDLLDFAINSTQKGQEGIRAILAKCLTIDNFWNEGTFAYNAYVLDVISQILTQAGIEGHMDRFLELREQASRMLLVTLDYRFDDNTLPNPNDSRSNQDVIPIFTHWQLFRTLPTYWGLAKAREWQTWESLLDPPESIPAKPPVLPTAVTRNFTAMRQAVLRAGDWQAFVHYGQTTANHFQNELLTFELHDGLTTLARDPGTVDYASPYHLDYFQRGAANNVPLVDGDGQTLWAPGDLKSFDAAEGSLTVQQPRYQLDAAATRSYRVTSGGFVERSEISVPSRSKRRLGVVFNTACEIRLLDGATAVATTVALPNVKAMRNYWNQVRMATSAGKWQARLDCAGKAYTMTVRGPANQRIYLGRVPDSPLPATRNAIYYEVEGTSATFETEYKPLN